MALSQTALGAKSSCCGVSRSVISGRLFTFPIYKAMQQAAGNDVVTVNSVKDKITGDIRLTPLTRDLCVTGDLVPAPEAARPNQPALIFLIWLQTIFSCMIYGPIAAYLVEAFPAKIRYTSVFLCLTTSETVFSVACSCSSG